MYFLCGNKIRTILFGDRSHMFHKSQNRVEVKAPGYQHIPSDLYVFFWVFPRRLIKFQSLWRWTCQRVPKRRQNFIRRRGNTQKKTYKFQNMAKIWNQEYPMRDYCNAEMLPIQVNRWQQSDLLYPHLDPKSVKKWNSFTFPTFTVQVSHYSTFRLDTPCLSSQDITS
jgi:hypothetical protein